MRNKTPLVDCNLSNIRNQLVNTRLQDYTFHWLNGSSKLRLPLVNFVCSLKVPLESVPKFMTMQFAQYTDYVFSQSSTLVRLPSYPNIASCFHVFVDEITSNNLPFQGKVCVGIFEHCTELLSQYLQKSSPPAPFVTRAEMVLQIGEALLNLLKVDVVVAHEPWILPNGQAGILSLANDIFMDNVRWTTDICGLEMFSTTLMEIFFWGPQRGAPGAGLSGRVPVFEKSLELRKLFQCNFLSCEKMIEYARTVLVDRSSFEDESLWVPRSFMREPYCLEACVILPKSDELSNLRLDSYRLQKFIYSSSNWARFYCSTSDAHIPEVVLQIFTKFEEDRDIDETVSEDVVVDLTGTESKHCLKVIHMFDDFVSDALREQVFLLSDGKIQLDPRPISGMLWAKILRDWPRDCDNSQCGNGICEVDEHQGTCPRDCFDNGSCGNGVCDRNENIASCPRDCNNSQCGNGICDTEEHQGTCPRDCFDNGSCGNNICNLSENAVTCPRDCASTNCGDGVCNLNEHVGTCPQDCNGDTCGNNICEVHENPTTCPRDCNLNSCPNGRCESFEHIGICPQDCLANPNCGNAICDLEETVQSCSQDCSNSSCRNNVCNINENPITCPEDCFTNGDCDNGICELNESVLTCPADCSNASCGNGICELDEHKGTCPKDCNDSSVCGDGICQLNENTVGCARDCGLELCPDGRCELLEHVGTCPQDCVLCGNKICEFGETPLTCSRDCSTSQCGNGRCDATENPGFCPGDCTCGNNICDPFETVSCSDCSVNQCGNGRCEVSENQLICAQDCTPNPNCGNNVCDPEETPLSCRDCNTSQCGDRVCDRTENDLSCPGDCFVDLDCGNGVCDLNESEFNCPRDCNLNECGDGSCDNREHEGRCPIDCSGNCGNGVCSPEEFPATCSEDCNSSKCGNGVCDLSEHGGFCPEDCFDRGTCGNGVCNFAETEFSCPQDCSLSLCGDGICSNDEHLGRCPGDCYVNPKCGNGLCEWNETPESCPDCTFSFCGDDTCQPFEQVGICNDCNLVCRVDGICETYETLKCPDCQVLCNNDGTCEANEITHNCNDCADLSHFEVNVFLDTDLNGILDQEERPIAPQTLDNPWVTVYLDSNNDGRYTANIDPAYSGNYPIRISVRKPRYNIGIVSDSLGELVIGYTAIPGLTFWSVDMTADSSPVVYIPVSVNLPPSARNIFASGTPGEAVVVSDIIQPTTDPNNNLDISKAIEIVTYPDAGRVQIDDNGVFTYTPISADDALVVTTYRICDTADLCSSPATITIKYGSPSTSINQSTDSSSTYTTLTSSSSRLGLGALLCITLLVVHL